MSHGENVDFRLKNVDLGLVAGKDFTAWGELVIYLQFIHGLVLVNSST